MFITVNTIHEEQSVPNHTESCFWNTGSMLNAKTNGPSMTKIFTMTTPNPK